MYLAYKKEYYYFDVFDLVRRLALTGGLILFGEESIVQIFLGTVISLFWLMALIHCKPYASEWDNFISISLGFQLLLTLIMGQSLQLFDLTPNQDEYQRQGFGMVILVTTSLSLSVSVGTTILSTPFFRKNVVTPIMIRCKKKTIDTVVKEDVGENENDNNGNASETEKMIANPMLVKTNNSNSKISSGKGSKKKVDGDISKQKIILNDKEEDDHDDEKVLAVKKEIHNKPTETIEKPRHVNNTANVGSKKNSGTRSSKRSGNSNNDTRDQIGSRKSKNLESNVDDVGSSNKNIGGDDDINGSNRTSSDSIRNNSIEKTENDLSSNFTLPPRKKRRRRSKKSGSRRNSI